MGLTGGIADVGSLYDCLMAMQDGHTDDSILDKYSEVRIKIWKEMIDPISRKNFQLIWDPNAEEQRKEFYAMTKRAQEDPEFARALANVSLAYCFAGLLIFPGYSCIKSRLFSILE